MSRPWIRQVWQRRGMRGKILWFTFLPASALYFIGVQLRGLCYSQGWLKTRTLERPVVSVGNLTVGGTGKTPTCIWLAQALQQRGLKVAILSRGYKRQRADVLILESENGKARGSTGNDDVLAAGDEPAMMARIFGQTVAVAKERYQAGLELLLRHDVDVFVLDDGYQHRRLIRNVDLLVLGSDHSGWTLPSGPFREGKGALRRADLYLITGAEDHWTRLIPENANHLSFRGSLQAKSLVGFAANGWKEHSLGLLGRRKILAVTAIADAAGFYRMIHDWEGEIIETLEFPDHHSYTSSDWQLINRAARNADLIITTEKDMLKLIRFPFARDKLLALRVAMEIENGDALVRAVLERIGK